MEVTDRLRSQFKDLFPTKVQLTDFIAKMDDGDYDDIVRAMERGDLDGARAAAQQVVEQTAESEPAPDAVNDDSVKVIPEDKCEVDYHDQTYLMPNNPGDLDGDYLDAMQAEPRNYPVALRDFLLGPEQYATFREHGGVDGSRALVRDFQGVVSAWIGVLRVRSQGE